MSTNVDIAIIGSGPYGLSIAAQLSRYGLDHRIFGPPMQFWTQHMPSGMLLKSEGMASSIFDADRQFTLARYCEERSIPYADLGIPVQLEHFSAYGLEFQKRMVPNLENCDVIKVDKGHKGFLIELSSGESFSASNVIVAVGVRPFKYVPPILAPLPREFWSHSSDHCRLDQFRDREVIILGGGASAVDTAVLLHECGGRAQLIARRPDIEVHEKMRLPRPLWDKLRYPMSGIGPGWKSRFYADAPLLFYWLPIQTRARIVQAHPNPAGGWFMRERFRLVEKVLGYCIKRARLESDRLCLTLVSDRGSTRELSAQHVIAATGFRIDTRQLAFLGESIQRELSTEGRGPLLSTNGESSVQGLYFAGPATANTFGPLARFVVGTEFAARRIARHLTRRTALRRHPRSLAQSNFVGLPVQVPEVKFNTSMVDRWRRSMQADYESAPTALALVHRQIVDRFGSRAIRVYEAGGGSRSCLPRQVIERSDIVVVDIDETQLQNNNYATKKIFGDIQTQSFQSNSFDLIVCYNVIEHLPAPHEAIRRFSAALSPNGLLVIGAPDPRSLYGMVTRFTPHWFHVWYYRTLLCSPNAGRPGHEPFPVFYHPTVEPHALMEFAKGLGLRPLLHHHYESPTIRFLQEKRPLVGASMRAAVRFLNLFAINGRNFGHGDYHVVFEKIG